MNNNRVMEALSIQSSIDEYIDYPESYGGEEEADELIDALTVRRNNVTKTMSNEEFRLFMAYLE